MVGDSTSGARAAALELPLPIVLVGAGERAFETVATLARRMPEELVIRAVVDPDAAVRERVAGFLGLPAEAALERLDPDAHADALHLIAAPLPAVLDTLAALVERGRSVALLPPIAAERTVLERLEALSVTARAPFTVANLPRASAFHRTVREIVRSGELGDLRTVFLRRTVAAGRTAHRGVRRALARGDADVLPFLLELVGPDLEALLDLLGEEPIAVSAVGARTAFGAERAPAGAAERCDAPCAAASSCAFDAARRYRTHQREWPFPDGVLRLAGSAYARCVYRNELATLDQLVVTLGLPGRHATYVLDLAAPASSTWLELGGSAAGLRGVPERGELLVRPLGGGAKRKVPFDGKTPPFLELVRSWRMDRAYGVGRPTPVSAAWATLLQDLVRGAFEGVLDVEEREA